MSNQESTPVKQHTRTLFIAASFTLVALAACNTTSTEKGAPGALPRAQSADVTPRLNASTYVAHGSLLERQGNFAQAAEQYRKALELTPDLPAARNRLGITLDKLGQHTEAAETFRAAIDRTPGQAHLHNNLGFSLYLDGQYAQAEQAFDRALELNPNFRRAHMNRGLVLARQARYDDALAAFKLACAEPDAYYNLALVQADAGHYADSARALEQALVLNPAFDEARQQLREVARMAATEEAAAAVIAAAQAENLPAMELPAELPQFAPAADATVQQTAGSAATAQQTSAAPALVESADVESAYVDFYARLEALLDGAYFTDLPEGGALDVIDLLARAMAGDAEHTPAD
jgi:Tfp pilus assembly protein PilF